MVQREAQGMGEPAPGPVPTSTVLGIEPTMIGIDSDTEYEAVR